MSQSDTPVPDVTAQVKSLTDQLSLLKAQMDLSVAVQAQTANTVKGILEASTAQATARFNLDAATAKSEFGQLAGIQTGIAASPKLPTGKEGTIQVSAGTAGTGLLRANEALLSQLKDLAASIAKSLPSGAVVISEPDLQQAYTAQVVSDLLSRQTQTLQSAHKAVAKSIAVSAPPPSAGPSGPALASMTLASGIAAAYSAGVALDTFNSLAKLLRTDLKLTVFGADEEAKVLFGYFLQEVNPAFVTTPSALTSQLPSKAIGLITKLDELGLQIVTATRVSNEIQQAAAAKVSPAATTEQKEVKLPDVALVDNLTAQIEAAKSLVDSLSPSKKADAFWVQVKGEVLNSIIDGRDRLIVDIRAQTVQINESTWYRADVMRASGAVQLAYRALGSDGSVKAVGVALLASKPYRQKFDEMGDINFRSGAFHSINR